MKKHTYKARLEAGLKEQGWTKRAPKAGASEGWFHDNSSKGYFVGTAGSLRYGPCKTKTVVAGNPQHQTPIYLDILRDGDAALNRPYVGRYF